MTEAELLEQYSELGGVGVGKRF